MWGVFRNSDAGTAQSLVVSHVGVEERREFWTETWGGVQEGDLLVIAVILGAFSHGIIRWVELSSNIVIEGNWAEIPKSAFGQFLGGFFWVFGGEPMVNFLEISEHRRRP